MCSLSDFLTVFCFCCAVCSPPPSPVHQHHPGACVWYHMQPVCFLLLLLLLCCTSLVQALSLPSHFLCACTHCHVAAHCPFNTQHKLTLHSTLNKKQTKLTFHSFLIFCVCSHTAVNQLCSLHVIVQFLFNTQPTNKANISFIPHILCLQPRGRKSAVLSPCHSSISLQHSTNKQSSHFIHPSHFVPAATRPQISCALPPS